MNSAQSKRRKMVMILLITLPFALAAIMWCLLPSGYRSFHAGQQKEVTISNHWHPLQPAIHQAIEFIKH